MMMMKKKKNHWDFLEEIEAPMWVDLTLEVDSNKQDGDDDWFYTSHLFHQCSSRELKIAFSHSGEESTALNLDLLGPSSPKLPSSVSRSRGKNYVSKKWRGDNQVVPIDKRHPVNVLSGTSSCVTSESSNNMKTKPSYAHLKGTSRSKSSWVSKSSSIGNGMPSCSQPISSCGDSTSTEKKADESNTASAITHESGQQQQQNMGKSSHPLSQASALLSLLKTGMRKSCVTRQASRVEINGDRRQSRGRNSSSGKSSVGSSSNPCYDVGSATSTSMQYKERTPDSRNMTRLSIAAKNKVKVSEASKTSTNKIEQGTSNYRMEPNTGKSTYRQAAKPKVQVQTLRRKPLAPVRVDENKLITATIKSKEKPVVGGSYRLAASGIENVKGLAASNKKENIVKGKATGSRTQKCNSKGVAAGTNVTGQKGTRNSIQQGHDRTGLAGKENIRVKSRLVSVKDISQRPHFR
ncbi:uncharacterized protein LOC133734852 [Rosa rugosa]|uniref:uncharacterized protein LOC133734852 n=1 Tax=Rosa rugosa TaxID=74645 RepID=UPI002B410AB7|nr:uncharacterized protein LOC133734852 [Rosa rugosa]